MESYLRFREKILRCENMIILSFYSTAAFVTHPDNGIVQKRPRLVPNADLLAQLKSVLSLRVPFCHKGDSCSIFNSLAAKALSSIHSGNVSEESSRINKNVTQLWGSCHCNPVNLWWALKNPWDLREMDVCNQMEDGLHHSFSTNP